MQNMATISTEANEVKMFEKSKMPSHESWDTIQFRMPMKDIVHPYSQLFPEDSSDTELDKTQNLVDNDFTSDLDEEVTEMVAYFRRLNPTLYNQRYSWQDWE